MKGSDVLYNRHVCEYECGILKYWCIFPEAFMTDFGEMGISDWSSVITSH